MLFLRESKCKYTTGGVYFYSLRCEYIAYHRIIINSFVRRGNQITRVLIILYPTCVMLFVHYAKKFNSITFLNRPRGCNLFFVLNSAEHEIDPTHKSLNANNCWHLTLISMIDTTSERLKAISFFTYRYCSFYEQLKFHAQLSLA